MGYDLSYAEPQGSVLRAKRAADKAYEESREGWYNMPRPHAYRYNIFGGGAMREALFVTGLMDERRVPDFPPYDAKASEAVRDHYTATVREILDRDYGGAIPSFKLGSNDGWLVTPAEIQRGIDRGMVERGLLSLSDAYDRRFVRWVIKSMEHGGFRTY